METISKRPATNALLLIGNHFEAVSRALLLGAQASVSMAAAELLLVPWCCVSGSPTSNGVWSTRATVLSAQGFAPHAVVDGNASACAVSTAACQRLLSHLFSLGCHTIS